MCVCVCVFTIHIIVQGCTYMFSCTVTMESDHMPTGTDGGWDQVTTYKQSQYAQLKHCSTGNSTLTIQQGVNAESTYLKTAVIVCLAQLKLL